MFGFGGSKKKEEKKEDKKTENVDMHISDTSNYNKGLDNPSDRLTNSIESVKARLEQASNELKTHLINYRNAHNPKIKENYKVKASNALKKKKMYEGQLASLENSQFALENMKIQNDMMKDQINVMKTMKDSSNHQKNLMKEMNADTMWDIAQDMREMQEDMNEVNEIFAESYKVDIDEGELDAELDELNFNMKDDFNPIDLNKPNEKLLSKKEMDEKALEDELI